MVWKKPLWGIAIAAMTLPASAVAQALGFYVGGAVGANLPSSSRIEGSEIRKDVDINTGGVAGLLSGGFAFQNGLRTELEVGYRRNDVDSVTSLPSAIGAIKAGSLMGNIFYDFRNSSPFTPYIGVGLGGTWINFDDVTLLANQSIDDFALTVSYQGITGVDYTITDDLHSFADYRYFRTVDTGLFTRDGLGVNAGYDTHSLMLGIRWLFGTMPQAASRVAAASTPSPPPPSHIKVPSAVVPRTYLVFFEFDKATLTSVAQQVLATAATDARAAKSIRIEVVGHTDRSGRGKYNQKLSLRRATAVKTDLVRHGIPKKDVTVYGRGNTEPLVTMLDGMRESRNRRVEIILR